MEKKRETAILVFAIFSFFIFGLTLTSSSIVNYLNDTSTAKNFTGDGDWSFLDYINLPKSATISNSSLNLTGIYTSSPITYLCYQESANTTDQTGIDGSCALNYSGGYSQDVYRYFANISAVIDGDWDTGSKGGVIFTGAWQGMMYVNYTKPFGALNSSIWQVKDENATANLTLLQNCFDQDPIQFYIYSFDWVDTGSSYVQWMCHDGTTWQLLRKVTIGSHGNDYAFEEAMIWNVSQYYYPSGVTLDVSDDGDVEFNHTGDLSTQNQTSDFGTEVSDFLSTCTADANGYCDLPLNISGTNGTVQISNINITFTTTPSYNILYPSNNSNFTDTGVDVNYTLTNYTALDVCKYSTNGGITNTSFTCKQNLTSVDWGQGKHTVTLYAKNIDGIENSSSITFTSDTIGPSVNIVFPAHLSEIDYNTSISLNHTTTDATIGVESCWWNIDGGANTTLAGCGNTTFNTSETTHTVCVYSNDTLGNAGSDCNTFTISLNGPAISLDSPQNATYWNTGLNRYFNITATDSNGLSTCQLWGDWTGTWHLNETFSSVTSGVQFSTQKNISSDGTYKYNAWCNDTTNQGRFSSINKTFVVDTTYPLVAIAPVSTTPGSQTFTFDHTVTELNPDSCKYSIYNSTGSLDIINSVATENVSVTCGATGTSATVSNYGTYTLRIYSVDLAGNENHTDANFTISQVSNNNGGGGAPGTPEELIPVIGLKAIDTPIYSDIEREILYAKINQRCGQIEEGGNGDFVAVIDYSGDCELTFTDIDKISSDVSKLGFSVGRNDMVKFFQAYNQKQFFQGFEQRKDVIKYGLFTSVLGIPNPMTIQPSTLRRPFFKFSLEDSFNITYNFIVNKNIRDCTVLEGGPALSCEVITNNTFQITYQINDTDFFDEIFKGRVSVTSEAKPENLEVKDVPLVLTVYNFASPVFGIPAYLLIGGVLVILIIIAFVIYGNKRFRKKLFKQRRDSTNP